MNEHEFEDLLQKIEAGLALGEKQLLHERALHDDTIVVYDPEQDAIVRVPAKEVLEKHPELRM